MPSDNLVKETKPKAVKTLSEAASAVMLAASVSSKREMADQTKKLEPQSFQGGIEDLTKKGNVSIDQNVDLHNTTDKTSITDTKNLTPEKDKPEQDLGMAATDGNTASPSTKNATNDRDMTIKGSGNGQEPMKSFSNDDVMNMFKDAVAVSLRDFTPFKPGGMKEHIDALFQDDVELSEDFKKKASTIFEAVLNEKLGELKDSLLSVYSKKLQESIAEYESSLSETIDSYLSYVVEDFIEKNKPILESNLKLELVDDFMTGMKKLFTENYLDIPSDKVDVIETLTHKISTMDTKLNEEFSKNVELAKEITEHKKAQIVVDTTKGFTDVQLDKFKKLIENVEHSSLDEYKDKLKIIKESFITGNANKTLAENVTKSSTPILPVKPKSIDEVDELNGAVVAEEKVIPVGMRPYTDFLDRTKVSPTAKDVIRQSK